MLILFWPWRNLADLRGVDESWESVFGKFSLAMSAGHQGVVENMQILHECRDSRDDHMQTRTWERPSGNAGLGIDGNNPGNEVEEIDMGEVLEHLEEIDRMSSRKNDEVDRETQECLSALAEAGFFMGSNCGVPTEGSTVGPELAPENDGALEDE
jgi:hypothetical protein